MNTIENKAGNAMKNVSDIVIHLGAGLGASAALYQELGYKKLVLVEVSAELANLLSKKLAFKQNIYIKNIAVSAQEEHIEFNHYSNPRYNSQLTLDPEFIDNSNLQLREQKWIPTLSLAQLTSEFQLTADQNNILIIELNGYEGQFLTALPLAQLNLFKTIIVNLQATTRYINQTNETALNTAFCMKGYKLSTTESNQFIYKKDELLSAISQTQVQQAELIDQLQSERETLAQENRILQENLQRMTEERDEQAHWNKKHKEWAETLQEQMATLKSSYTEGERSQNLALKLQAKAQVDLDHLRQQYQQKLHNEQKLIELIKELQLKLKAADSYYHQLQIQHPEFNTEPSASNYQEPTQNNLSGSANTIDAKVINSPQQQSGSKNASKKRK
jgi:FkbM family methyltransferase